MTDRVTNIDKVTAVLYNPGCSLLQPTSKTHRATRLLQLFLSSTVSYTSSQLMPSCFRLVLMTPRSSSVAVDLVFCEIRLVSLFMEFSGDPFVKDVYQANSIVCIWWSLPAWAVHIHTHNKLFWQVLAIFYSVICLRGPIRNHSIIPD